MTDINGDPTERLKDAIPEPYPVDEEGTEWDALLTALGNQFADLDRVRHDIRDSKSVEDATRAQLDKLASIVQTEKRNSESLADYRARLKVLLRSQLSTATRDEIREVVAVMLGADASEIDIIEPYDIEPAFVEISADIEIDDSRFVEAVELMTAAGVTVGVRLYEDASETAVIDGSHTVGPEYTGTDTPVINETATTTIETVGDLLVHFGKWGIDTWTTFVTLEYSGREEAVPTHSHRTAFDTGAGSAWDDSRWNIDWWDADVGDTDSPPSVVFLPDETVYEELVGTDSHRTDIYQGINSAWDTSFWNFDFWDGDVADTVTTPLLQKLSESTVETLVGADTGREAIESVLGAGWDASRWNLDAWNEDPGTAPLLSVTTLTDSIRESAVGGGSHRTQFATTIGSAWDAARWNLDAWDGDPGTVQQESVVQLSDTESEVTVPEVRTFTTVRQTQQATWNESGWNHDYWAEA